MNTYSNVAHADSGNHEDLVTAHIGLVKRIAQHLIARLPSTVDIDDLMQAGMIGLLEAANNFDETKGASFETYAGIRIRGAMLDDIRRYDWTPRSVHHKYRKVSAAISKIENEKGAPAASEEVAAVLDISLDDYHKILSDSASSRLFSLDETIDETNWHRTVPRANTDTPEQQMFDSQFREFLAGEIEKLPERERLVLSLYYERELNLKEIGRVLDVTESRVCQIHVQAMLRLRAVVGKW
jgi:RNA polymerase sigma factor FliA